MMRSLLTQNRKYTYVGISLNELQGLMITCTAAQLSAKGVCPISSGEQTIETLGLDKYTIHGCALILVAMIIFFRLMAYLAIRFIKW
jgi:ATP-binding cassette subfamily G (WHITE) protein 2